VLPVSNSLPLAMPDDAFVISGTCPSANSSVSEAPTEILPSTLTFQFDWLSKAAKHLQVADGNRLQTIKPFVRPPTLGK